MVAWIWILIPLAALLLGGFSEWLKFKKESAKLNASAHDLQADLTAQHAEFEALRAAHDDLIERIQNLEAIVTSEDWDRLPDAPPPIDLDAFERPSDQEHVARRARRLRTR